MSNHQINILYDDKQSDSSEEEEVTQVPISNIDCNLPDRIVVVGGSMSGKTTVIRNLVQIMKKKNRVGAVWWLGKNSSEETWLPEQFRRNNISKKLLTSIQESQKKPVMNGIHQIVILDDVLEEQFHRDKWWDGFISSCRHQLITLIFGIQYLKSISPCIRNNVQRFIVTHANNETLDSLNKLSSVPNRQDWRNTFTKIKIGQPVVMDCRPGKNELVLLSVPRKDSVV